VKENTSRTNQRIELSEKQGILYDKKDLFKINFLRPYPAMYREEIFMHQQRHMSKNKFVYLFYCSFVV
jgi:hypothetical protein